MKMNLAAKMRIMVLALLCAAAFVHAEECEKSVLFQAKNEENAVYSIRALYDNETFPGDAVFVRLKIEPESKGSSFLALKNHKISARLSLKSDADAQKTLSKADFYDSGKSLEDFADLLSGLPLSSFAAAGAYTLFVEFSAFGNESGESLSDLNQSLELKITVKEKEFVSETIPLDSKNTSIKTDDSQERINQINRLNKILYATDNTAVYQTAAFSPPVSATRRTSFFADRRTYVYTGGGSSTSLHYGIDYGVGEGTKVFSCAAGKVVMAEFRISTGWSVCVEHLPGLYSLYYHMSVLDSENAKVGKIIKQGDLIGLSGSTGLATGPHLHWEVRLLSEAVSPDFFTEDFAFEKRK